MLFFAVIVAIRPVTTNFGAMWLKSSSDLRLRVVARRHWKKQRLAVAQFAQLV